MPCPLKPPTSRSSKKPIAAGTTAKGPASTTGSTALLPRGAAPLNFAAQYNNDVELRGYFNGLLSEWSMKHYTVDEYIAQGDVVVARGSCAWTHKKTGKLCETPKLDYWRFKDGKAVEFYEYFDTAAAAAAAT